MARSCLGKAKNQDRQPDGLSDGLIARLSAGRKPKRVVDASPPSVLGRRRQCARPLRLRLKPDQRRPPLVP